MPRNRDDEQPGAAVGALQHLGHRRDQVLHALARVEPADEQDVHHRRVAPVLERRRERVEAVDVHTTGLGGDSHVRYDREGELRIGPRRAVPLSLLAHDYPEVVEELRAENRNRRIDSPRDVRRAFTHLRSGRPGPWLRTFVT